MFLLPLILLSLSAVDSDSHSLRYYITGVSAPGFGLPEFSIVGYVDDQQTQLYTSDTRKLVPGVYWMKEILRPEQWEIYSRRNKAHEKLFRYEMEQWKKRLNHTGGFHSLQMVQGCELRDDGSTVGYEQFRYDGEELMFYDTSTRLYIATMAKAQTITQRWNIPGVGRVETTRNFMENGCIERLKRFITYGREDLERRVRPEVKVSSWESDGVTKLHCQVYGFHPRAVDVKWMKNGIDQVPSYQTTHVLPNPDGTYQIRVTVEVIPQEGDSYSCYVDHNSLEEPLLVKWEPTQSSTLAVIISAVIIIIVVVTFSGGFILYRRKKKNVNYTAAGNALQMQGD